jgi:1-acyl-sn-glycerol-3-phosphate acyltransferase
MEFGAPVDLAHDAQLTGRQRLAAATEQVRTTLADHVAAASARHGISLPDDVG